MRNERGGVKLITLVGILIAMVLVLFIIVFLLQYKKTEETNTIKNQTNTLSNTIPTQPIATPEPTKPIETENPKDLVNTDFTLGFLKKENEKKNMIYSPLSIKYALKMLQEGANGNTSTQIQNVVGSLNLPKYNNINEVLSLANGLYIRDKYYPFVKNTYIDTLTNKYNAEVVQDKFENAKNVNNWIENRTLGIIKNMLQDKMVQNPDLQMLLINALAIDMEWQARFDTKDTYGNTFYLDGGTEINATTMNNKTSSNAVSYCLEKDVTALSMDLKEYEGTQMEFMAIMPDKNLDQYINNLTIEKINDITKKLNKASNTPAGVQLSIPKFSFDYNLKLKQDLIDMGITDAFNREFANFSNMAELEKTGKNLYVSDALHKANIDFTEKGVKAAAVTVFAMMDATAVREPRQPVIVNINKPFLFIIRDKNTKEIWFTGTVYEPNLWENDKAKYEMRY